MLVLVNHATTQHRSCTLQSHTHCWCWDRISVLLYVVHYCVSSAHVDLDQQPEYEIQTDSTVSTILT